MLDDLLFSLGIVLPLFMVMLLGFGLKRIKLINDGFSAAGNKLMFYIGLPAIVFRSIYRADVHDLFEFRFIGGMLAVTALSVAAIWLIAIPYIKDKPVRGAFILSAFRGNQAFLGIPLMINLAGDAGGLRATMVATFVLPVANVLSILVLAANTDESQRDPSLGGKSKKTTPKAIVMTIVRNPIVITTLLGMAVVLPGIQLPGVVNATLDYVADMSTPLALLCIGAGMRFDGFNKKFNYAVTASFIKIIAMPLVFAGGAYLLGLRGVDLAAMTIMGGVPSAIAGYAMVVEMGGDGYTSSTIVIISTLLSAFTLTLFIYAIRVLGVLA
jgi:hypothetical protein